VLVTRAIRTARPNAGRPVAIGRAAGNLALRLGRFENSPHVRTFGTARALVGALESGRVAAAVRGTLPAKRVVQQLERLAGGNPLCRGALLEPRPGRGVVLGPVGITEGGSAAARARFAVEAAGLLARAGLLSEPPLVAVLSIGRPEDAGRGAAVARSVAQSAHVVKLLESRGLDAFSAGVQLEDVLFDADIVVAPDGASGNLAFRALHLTAGMRSFGGLLLGLRLPFVDTSRARASFDDPLRLAAYLAAPAPRG